MPPASVSPTLTRTSIGGSYADRADADSGARVPPEISVTIDSCSVPPLRQDASAKRSSEAKYRFKSLCQGV